MRVLLDGEECFYSAVEVDKIFNDIFTTRRDLVMQKFYGTKLIQAKPMTRLEYNKFRGWELPADEDGADEGYLVEYLDGGKPNVEGHAGYVSWSPKEQFDNAYQPTDRMSFGHAVCAMKDGKKVARAGWNGKGMFLYFVRANSYPATTGIAKEYFGGKPGIAHIEQPGESIPLVPYCAYIAMKTAQENVVVWTASQSDVLSDDWQIVD